MRNIFILVAAACLTAQTAFAHAMLDRASPAVGSEVSGSPATVSLTYTEPVEPLFSSIHITDASGVRMDEGQALSHSGNERVLEVALKKLPPGVYTVEWQVTSVDTHKTQGHFRFTVKP